MPRPGRLVRKAVNPLATAATGWWCHSRLSQPIVRHGREWSATEGRGSMLLGPRTHSRRVLSPGDWFPPPGVKPGWNWLPQDHGASPRLDLVPLWVRLCYHTPVIDRFAHVWMWHHGGWEIAQPAWPPHSGRGDSGNDGDPAGDREPRRPAPHSPALAQQLDVPSDSGDEPCVTGLVGSSWRFGHLRSPS